MVFDYVLLQCIPYVMATVLENAELCDTVSQCANLRVYKVHEFVRPLYMFVSQLHICEWASEYVEGRGAVLVAGSEVDRSGNLDQWLHRRSYSRRRSWSECGVDSLKVFALGSKPREV